MANPENARNYQIWGPCYEKDVGDRKKSMMPISRRPTLQQVFVVTKSDSKKKCYRKQFLIQRNCFHWINYEKKQKPFFQAALSALHRLIVCQPMISSLWKEMHCCKK